MTENNLIDVPKFVEPKELDIRYTKQRDVIYLTEWFANKEILKWFPMREPNEIEDSIQRWISFHKWKCSLTATINSIPVGIATLWLQPYKKVAHQCQFGIIVDSKYRKQKVGSSLLKNLIHLAKNYFHIELLHLEVYDGNDAYFLYKSFGFKEFGRQTHWIKDQGQYVGRIFMEKFL